MEQPPQKIEKVERLKEMPKSWLALRERILDNFESKTDGLDIESVAEFMWSQGLPVTDSIFFYEEDIPQLNKTLEGFFSVEEYPSVVHRGMYLQELDLIFIERSRELENLNGPVVSEGAFVHELAHAGNGYEEYAKRKAGIMRSRGGFGVLRSDQEDFPWGWFLEEGFAEMIRGEYMEKNRQPKELKKLCEVMKEYGISVRSGMTAGFSPDYEIAVKYAYLDSTGDIGHAEGSIAAMSLEMLCEKEPKLRQTLIEARSDVLKLKEIPKLINAIKPGLYVKIQKCDSTFEDFLRVKNIIKEVIQNN